MARANSHFTMNLQFENKVALVTGATSGIGRAMAIAFRREGAKVIVAGRREKEGRDVVALVKRAGGEAEFVRTDVASETEVAALVAESMSTYGRLDMAFNNAGVEDQPASIHEQTLENYHRVMNANVLGVFLSLKHEIAAMLKNGGGAIVNNSSVAGLIGFPGAAIYVAEHAPQNKQPCTQSAAPASQRKSPRPSCGCAVTRRPSSRAKRWPWTAAGRRNKNNPRFNFKSPTRKCTAPSSKNENSLYETFHDPQAFDHRCRRRE